MMRVFVGRRRRVPAAGRLSPEEASGELRAIDSQMRGDFGEDGGQRADAELSVVGDRQVVLTALGRTCRCCEDRRIVPQVG
ncbi:MAG: hypothetical protein ACT4PJ_13355 [Gemmatimonadaceae bacterium]